MLMSYAKLVACAGLGSLCIKVAKALSCLGLRLVLTARTAMDGRQLFVGSWGLSGNVLLDQSIAGFEARADIVAP
jgi:hypothetical protein